MELRDFATKTQIIARPNRSVGNSWVLGIDNGFSSVKGFAPNKAFTFPNCAYKLTGRYETFTEPSSTDIVVSDADGTWVVGELALQMMADSGGMNYEQEMYGRTRYFTPTFREITKVGLAIGLMQNHAGAWDGISPITVQTGLPPKYLLSDREDLKDSIAGNYDFEIKIGKAPFERFKFTINRDNVFVMDQPMGTMVSCVTDKNGFISKEQSKLLERRTLIADPGFNTFDTYDIASKMLHGDPQTLDIGMGEILRRTADELNMRYGTNLSITDMQIALRKGYVTQYKRRERKTEKVEFADILEAKNREVCLEAMGKMEAMYSYLQYHDNLVVTGGTGDAWFKMIQDYFAGMSTLSVISGNRNDPALPNNYSNVRGYYLFRVGKMTSAQSKRR